MRFRLKTSVRITLLYICMGILWIVLSDYALAHILELYGREDRVLYQVVKGSVYVLFTSALLFVLIENHSRRLRQKIQEAEGLNDQLNTYAHKLELSNRELEQFSYITSHDLQEPLRNITSFLKRLKEKCSDNIDERGHLYLHYAMEGSDRMRKLIRDALALHQVHADIKPDLTHFSLNLAVHESLLLIQRQVEKKQAYIIIEPLPEVYSNKDLLIKLLYTLLSNSLIYQRDGVPPGIRIFHKTHKHHWEIFIQDNGIGIDPHLREEIFVAFRRLHPQNRFCESGTGVGLAMARKIVQILGGTIRLMPQPEGQPGATFCFSLPKKLESELPPMFRAFRD